MEQVRVVLDDPPTMADAERVLREFLRRILDEREYKPREIEIKALTSDGANYTTCLFLVNVSSAEHHELKLFAKVACLGHTMRSVMSADWLYSTERIVYTQIVDIYKDIEDRNNVPNEYRFVFPKCYGCNSELGKETVVMENLIEAGFTMYDRHKSMDWDHASVAVENLARFHALSFAFEKHYPDVFWRLAPGMKFKMGIEHAPSEDEVALWTKMLDGYLEVIKEEHRGPVSRFLLDERVQEKIKKYTAPRGKPVISHGDYRMSKVMFRKRNISVVDTLVPTTTMLSQNLFIGRHIKD